MDTPTLRVGRPVPWRRALLLLGAIVGLGLVATAIVAFFWLRSYGPLEQGSFYGGPRGTAKGVLVQPVEGSGGIPVVFPRYRPDGRFKVTLAVRNRSRFAVTLLGLPRPSDDVAVFDPVAAEVSPPNDAGVRLRPLDASHSARISPGEERGVTITYRIASRCRGGQPRHYWGNPQGAIAGQSSVALRVKYARFFERSQHLQLPFAMLLVCRIGVTTPTR